MDVYVMNTNFQIIGLIDTYKSLIWTSRFFEPGDFELYIPADPELLKILKKNYYVVRDDTSEAMIIEKIEITTDAENGDFFIVSGRSLLSIIGRRIVWKPMIFDDEDPAAIIVGIIHDNCTPIIIPDDYYDSKQRFISGLTLKSSVSTGESTDTQVTGDNVLEKCSEIAKEFGIGLKMYFDFENTDGHFIFECYLMPEVDVTFSPEFDNLINTDYVYDNSNYANVAMVAGEGEGLTRWRRTSYLCKNEPTGLDRREVFVDARDLSTDDTTHDKYEQQLKQRGKEKLTDYIATETFSGDVAPSISYEYKKDYDLGNVVNIENEYGITAKSRIVEIIESWDDNGYSVIPTLQEWEVT